MSSKFFTKYKTIFRVGFFRKDLFRKDFFRRPKLKTIVEGITEVSYLLTVFLVPLWFAYFFPTYNVFELNKTIVFRSLVSVLAFFTVWRLVIVLSQPGEKQLGQLIVKQLKSYYIIPAALLVGLSLSLFFSLDPAISFFGSYDRQQGLASQWSYFLWSALVFVNLLITANRKETSVFQVQLRRILITVAWSGALVALYGILQILNIDFMYWPEPAHLTGRALSTFGQPNFLASFLLLVIPVSAYLAYSSSKFLIRFLYLLFFSAQIICLFFTSSRGGLLAFMAVAFLFGVYLIFASKLQKKIKLLAVGTIILFGLAGVGAMELSNPGRLKESFDPNRGSLAARVFFFQAAADAVWHKPLFGHGLENGSEVFIKYYERDWALYGKVSANADRAHNLILDILVNSGFIGLILFTLWYYFILRLGIKNILMKIEAPLSLALTGAVSAYLISLLFSFPLTGMEVYFWLLFSILAFVSAVNSRDYPSLRKWHQRLLSRLSFIFRLSFFSRRPNYRWVGLIIIFIVLLASAWQLRRNAHSLLADYYHNEMFVAFSERDMVYAALLRKQVAELDINPVQRERIDYFFGSYLGSHCSYGVSRDLTERKIVELKASEILTLLPANNYPNIFLKAQLASCLGDLGAADYYFDLATEISPELPLTHIARGYHFFLLDDLEQAEKYYQQADINLPDLNSPVINSEHRLAAENYKFLMYNSLGEGYFRRANYERAEKFFQAAYRQRPTDFSLFKKIADCYYLRDDLDTAITYVKRGAQASPRDYKWFVALAILSIEKGESEAAGDYLDKAWDLAPEEERVTISELRLKHDN